MFLKVLEQSNHKLQEYILEIASPEETCISDLHCN